MDENEFESWFAPRLPELKQRSGDRWALKMILLILLPWVFIALGWWVLR